MTLDFIPEGTDLQPILPVLARVFERALAGGGAKNINFNELAADLAEITYNYPFRIPPYFALIIRAIGVLEGIALVADPEFAIIDQSYPFLSKLLLTDRSPRLRAALQYMIYGKGKVFDADRLIDLLQAFETFASNSKTARGNMDAAASPSQGRLVANTTYTPTMPAGGSFPLGFPFPLPLPFPLPPPVARLPAPAAAFLPPGSSANPLEAVFGMAAAAVTAGTSLALPSPFATPASAAVTTAGAPSSSGAREALRFVLSPEGEFFREFVMDELVKSIDALSREQLFVLASQLGVQGAQVPVLLPGAKRASVPLAPQLSDEDRQVVDNVAKLLNFFLRGSSQQRGGGGLLAAAPNAEVIGELLPLLPTVANQVLPQLAQRLASRVGARVLRELYLE